MHNYSHKKLLFFQNFEIIYFLEMNRSLSKILKKKLEDEDQEEVKIPTKKLKSRPVVSSIPVDGTHILNNSNLNRLKSEFFKQDCLSLSKSLLGKYLIRSINSGSENSCIIGKIVECEAYLGGDDKASHSYDGKKTERTEAMYMQAGTLYGTYFDHKIKEKHKITFFKNI